MLQSLNVRTPKCARDGSNRSRALRTQPHSERRDALTVIPG
jgi:hypothetical protein